MKLKGTEWMRIITVWGERIKMRVLEKKKVGLMKGRFTKSRYPVVKVDGQMLTFVSDV